MYLEKLQVVAGVFMWTRVLLISSFWVAASAQAACYAVYDAKDKLVFRGSDSPVDLSRPIARQVHAIWPGGHLVISAPSPACTPVDSRIAELPIGGRNTNAAVTEPAPQKSPSGKKRATEVATRP